MKEDVSAQHQTKHYSFYFKQVCVLNKSDKVSHAWTKCGSQQKSTGYKLLLYVTCKDMVQCLLRNK